MTIKQFIQDAYIGKIVRFSIKKGDEGGIEGFYNKASSAPGILIDVKDNPFNVLINTLKICALTLESDRDI